MHFHRWKRREFITLLGGAATASLLGPVTARAQQAALPVVGFLSSTSPGHRQAELAAFHAGLKEAGNVDGQNVRVEFQWAEGRYDLLSAMAADLVRRQVAVIAAIAQPAAVAAKQATATIPIVTVIGGDPVKLGLVASLSRPGGNLTGATYLANVLTAKQLEVMHELLPRSAAVGVLINKSNPNADTDIREAEAGARALGRVLVPLHASTERDIDAAFAVLTRERAGGLIVIADPFLLGRQGQIVALAAQHAMPAIYPVRDFPVAGGLMSYGTSLAAAYRLVGIYTGRILKGERPGDLPVQQSTKIELVVNLKTAKALGLDIPATVLARADEVIE
jgi:ABC-type uncharacterized transport system substrate-binding protein